MRETTLLRIPREHAHVPNVELRVGHRAHGVHIREWWLPRSGENSAPTRNGIVVRPDELDAVIAALTEAKRLLAQTRMPWRKEAPCPRCQGAEAQQPRRSLPSGGALPSDYYCGLCGAVDGPLRKEVPVKGEHHGNDS